MSHYSYYIIFLVMLIPILLSKKTKYVYWITSILFLSIVTSLRYNFGADYTAYSKVFNLILTNQAVSQNYERFYVMYNQLIQSLGFDYAQFVAINTIILLFFVISWILTSSRYKYQSFFVYVSFFLLVWNLSTYRQAMALSFGVLLLYNRKLNFHLIIKLLIVPILALFHVSALFFGVLLILGEIPWKKYYLLFLLVAGLLFTLLPTQEIIAQAINHPNFDVITNIYKIRYYFAKMTFTTGFFSINAMMRIFFFGLIWIHYEILTNTKYLKNMTDIFLVGMSLYFFLSFNALFASRLTIYALILLVILLPEILAYYEDKKPWMRIAAMSMFIGLCTFMYFKDLYAIKEQLGIDDGKWYVEYQSILDQDVIVEK